MSHETNVPENERRRYFRVDDAIHMSYRLIRSEELPDRLARIESELESDFTVMSSLAVISQQMSGVMHKLEAGLPEVANYLKGLDRKIDILGRAFILQNSDVSDRPTDQVNLSASGVAFTGDEPLESGSTLELKMLLFPAFTGILTFGEVVGCEPVDPANPESGYAIRVNFAHLRENDRDVIIRHVIRRQSEMLRQKREASYD